MRYLHVFLICGSYNFNLAQAESNVQPAPNYKIALLAGTVSRANLSLISLPPEDICFLFFFIFPPRLSSGSDPRSNSISSAAERPGNYLFLRRGRDRGENGEEIEYHPLRFGNA